MNEIRGQSIDFLKLDFVVIIVEFFPKYRLYQFRDNLSFHDGLLKQSLVATNISNSFIVEFRRKFRFEIRFAYYLPYLCQIHLKTDERVG